MKEKVQPLMHELEVWEERLGMLVPELAYVEREIVRALTAQTGAEELFGTESKGTQIREVETMIEGTWRRG